MYLNELFKIYKDISKSIILALENDNLDLLDSLLLKRQEILDDILIQGSHEELQELYKKFDLFSIDNIMKEKFQSKMSGLKAEMVKLRKGKEASKGYNNLKTRAVYLSKEI